MNKMIKNNFSLLMILASLVSCGVTNNPVTEKPITSTPTTQAPTTTLAPTTTQTPTTVLPSIEQIKTPEAISKSYFQDDVDASTFTIDLYEYVNVNGREDVEFMPSISNADAASLTIEGHILKVTVNNVPGTFDLTVSVNVNRMQEFALTFPLTITKIAKVACIGDSLTQGHSWSSQAYPVYLQSDFKAGVSIGNYGRNGANITSYGGSGSSYQYTKLTQYTNSKSFNPDVAVIMLGTNDATGWENAQATFETLYRSLIQEYISLNAQVVIVTSPPTIMPNAFNIPNEVIRDSVNPIQRKVAKELNLPLVDAREEFENHPEGVRALIRSESNDNVHLSVKGAEFIAELISNKIKTL